MSLNTQASGSNNKTYHVHISQTVYSDESQHTMHTQTIKYQSELYPMILSESEGIGVCLRVGSCFGMNRKWWYKPIATSCYIHLMGSVICNWKHVSDLRLIKKMHPWNQLWEAVPSAHMPGRLDALVLVIAAQPLNCNTSAQYRHT